MSWLTNYVRPKLQTIVPKDVPDNLWLKCPSCQAMLYHKELDQNFQICNQCNYHLQMSTSDRLKMLFDDSEYSMINLPKSTEDPIKFQDIKSYSERINAARDETNQYDAISVALGKIGGIDCVIGVFNFNFMGGSMGTTVGEAIIKACDTAIEKKASLILVTASGGARMQEGILSLMQMARTTLAINKLKDAGLPYFVIYTNPTAGGVSASFAMLGDFQIAEPGAIIAFAGKRVIEQTIRTQLPDNFQKSEYLRDHGMVDAVVDRRQLKDTIVRLNNLVRKP